MEYKTKDIIYDAIGPGTAGVAQRISSREMKEIRGLFALVQNDVVTCGQNQY